MTPHRHYQQIQEKTFPEKLKISNVSTKNNPLTSETSIDRPVSLIQTFSKVIETNFLERLWTHFEQNNLKLTSNMDFSKAGLEFT